MEPLISEQRAGVAGGATCTAKEQLPPALCVFGQGATGKPGIIGAVKAAPFGGDESPQRVADLYNRKVHGFFNSFIGFHKHIHVGFIGADPGGNDGPGCVDPVVGGPGDVVFAGVSGHLELGDEGEEGLRGDDIVEALGQPFLGGGVKAVSELIRNLKPPIMKQDVN